jgi:hypothetical protein
LSHRCRQLFSKNEVNKPKLSLFGLGRFWLLYQTAAACAIVLNGALVAAGEVKAPVNAGFVA